MSELIPPHDLDIERSLIWSMLIDWSIVSDVISEILIDDIYWLDNKKLYQSIYSLAIKEVSIDLMTVKDSLQSMDVKMQNPKFKWWSDIDPFIKTNELESIWWVTTLVELTEWTPSSGNYREYIRIIKKYSNLRKIQRVAKLCLSNIDNNLPPEEVIKFLEQWIRKATVDNKSGDIILLSEVLSERIEELADWLEDNVSQRTISTWFKDLDIKLWSLQWWNLTVIWWRPWQGKSWIVLNMIYNNILKWKRVAFFSLEMNKREIANRIISMVSDVNSFKLKSWTNRPNHIDKDKFIKWRTSQYEDIIQSIDWVMDKQLYIDDTTNLTPKKIKSRLARITMEEKIDLVVVDYIWLMKSDTKWLNKTNEIADITRELKIIAWEHDCPIIALSQLNRSLESRANKRPMMSDLRDSWAIEQDANQILFLYRDRYYDEFSLDDTLEIIISKNRDWWQWTINVEYNLEKQLITDCTKEKKDLIDNL